VQELKKVALPSLKRLNLNDNRIKTCAEFEGHAGIELLELRKNKLRTVDGIGRCPSLKELYIDEN